MRGAAEISIVRFLLIYIMLLIVLAVMKKCRIRQTKLLLAGSIRMTLQLVLAGFLLTYIFKNPHPLFTITYIIAMVLFSLHRILSQNRDLNTKFKAAIVFSLSLSGILVILFFILVVINQSIFNPQYAIPLSGMIFGNTMTGVNIGIKTFRENLESSRNRIEALINFGGRPKQIVLPLVNQSLETAMLPTLNSMLGMGIISLPGMMTGQILSGTLPTTAILYQIAIMIAICTVVCLSVFGSLYLGYQSLYNHRSQFIF